MGIFRERIDREWQRHVMRISERNDFIPNKTKEVSLQKYQSGTSHGLQSGSGHHDFFLQPSKKKGAERKAFFDRNDCNKSYRSDSRMYGEMRLPECILMWHPRWKKYIVLHNDYFECDRSADV